MMGLYSGPSDETVRIELNAMLRRLKDARGMAAGLIHSLDTGGRRGLHGDLEHIISELDPLIVILGSRVIEFSRE